MPFKHFTRFVILSLGILLAGNAAAQQEIELDVKGVKGELKDNVDIYLQKFQEDGQLGGVRFHDELQQQVQLALQALGYYHAEISLEASSDNARQLIIMITPGEPLTYAEADIQLTGDAQTDIDFISLLNSKAPRTGQVVHHGAYDGFKHALRNLAVRKGYFDAQFTVATLQIAPELNRAFVQLHFSSGKRYQFGDITFSGNQIKTERLQSLLPFASGDAYLAASLGELNQSLASSGWFSSILVEGDAEHIENFQLPINITVEPERRNIIETGIGYSTNEQFRVKLNWQKPWLNNLGHSFRTDIAVSAVEQSVEATYKIPQSTAATDFYQVQLGFRNKNHDDTDSRESNLVLERYWRLENDWYRIASLRWLYEDFVQADQQDNISLIMPGISFNRSRQKGGAMPHSADRLSIRVEVADEAWLSDASLVRVRGRAGWIGSLGDNHRFVTRVDAGGIFMESLRNLPPSIRFFAGGDNSIRGYCFESVGPRNEQGEITGGRYMLTGSLEYQYRISSNWWVAAFGDYGSAWDENPDWVRGVGTGIRWASPAGPVRLDFAFGLDQPDGSSAFQLHFSLGPEL